MKKIFCVMGKSGSGKSTLINQLSKNPNIRFNPIKSFSTRLPRNIEDLDTHIFVDNSEYEENLVEGNVFLDYYDSLNDYHNYVTEELFKDDCINLFAVDIKAFKKLAKSEKYEVYGIYLDLREDLRMERLEKRDGKSKGSETHLDFVKCRGLFKIDLDKKNPYDETLRIIEHVFGGGVLW